MANRLEAFGNYTGSVINRIIGRSAWRKAIKQEEERIEYKKELFGYTPHSEKPAWARPINVALDSSAPAYLALEFLAPATSRLMLSVINDDEKSFTGKYDFLKAGALFATLPFDVTLNYFCLTLVHNPLEAVAYKLAANAATHVGLDLAGTAVNRIRHLRPPTSTTLSA